ncbi:MAG TPA: hypothetical protein VJT15_02625 [Pyrinomonadaceae bacterium]|nr:hypothetical protein [Pyrinomonadaceae bacterium]
MSSFAQMDVHFAIPFDHTLFIEEELLGAVRSIGLQGGRLELPCDGGLGRRKALRPPVSAPDTLTRCLPNGSWGRRAEADPKISVQAALVVLSTICKLDFDLAGNQIGGESVNKAAGTVSSWFASFSHWLWVLTSQNLDPMNPDPKVLHRRSGNTVITASADGKTSLPVSGPSVASISLTIDGPRAERLVNQAVLDVAVQNAGIAPSMTLELLASARMAARRGDNRRSLIDAGTAVEAALSHALGLGNMHLFTLGSLITQAENQGLTVPADTRTSLVHPRNDAVHRGLLSASINIDRALEVAELIASLADPYLVPIASLTPVNRPQWNEIVFIKGPS